jgi:2TM domain
MTTIALEDYEAAEREFSMHEARNALRVHALVTVLIWAAVIPINVIVAPQFPWSIFVVAGTGIGLFFHWFGQRHPDQDIRRRRARIEERARTAHGG